MSNMVCTYNISGDEFTCVLPEPFQVLTDGDTYFETIDAGDGNYFVVDKTISYGDLTISFFLFILIVMFFSKIIFDLFFARSVRIKKYEL